MRKDFLQFFPCKSIICYLLFFSFQVITKSTKQEQENFKKSSSWKSDLSNGQIGTSLWKILRACVMAKALGTSKRQSPMTGASLCSLKPKSKERLVHVLFDVGDCVVKNAGHFSQIIGPTSIFSNLEMFSRCFCVFTSVCHKILNNKNLTFFTAVMAMLHFFLLNRANEVLRFNVLSKLTVCVLSTYSS